MRLRDFGGVGLAVPEKSLERCAKSDREADSVERGQNGLLDHILAHGRGGARLRVAAIVNAAFLERSGESATTACTREAAPKNEIVRLLLRIAPSFYNGLNAFEQLHGQERLMHPLEGLARPADAHNADVEGVSEHDPQTVPGKRLPVPVHEPTPGHLLHERIERMASRREKFEGSSHERRPLRIDSFHFAFALIEIADRRRERPETLFQAAAKAFLHLLAVVADEVRRDDRLDIGGETPAAGGKVEILVRKIDLHAGVDELSKVGPVAEVPGATVDLVDDDTVRRATPQKPHHFGEARPAALCGRELLLKPADDSETLPFGIAKDRVFLLLEGYAFFTLAGGGYTDVPEDIRHVVKGIGEYWRVRAGPLRP